MSDSGSAISSKGDSDSKSHGRHSRHSTSRSHDQRHERKEHGSDSHSRKSHRRSRRSRSRERRKVIKCITVTDSTAGILIPDGATAMEILLIGGGGGGGNSGGSCDNIPKFGGGGGGGGATYENSDFCVKAGESLSIVIGAGGAVGALHGANGEDGGDTILTYGCFKKKARGGKGGGGSFNSSFGGEGGESQKGAGNDGDNGYTNINSLLPGVNQQGGAGGLSGLAEQSPYGNGGYGRNQDNAEPCVAGVVTTSSSVTSATTSGTTKVRPSDKGGIVTPDWTPPKKGGGGGGSVEPNWTPPRGGWGSGGNSGSVSSSTSTAPVAQSETKVSSLNAVLAAGITPGQARVRPHAAIVAAACRSYPDVMYNTSNNGTPGYCRLTFFTTSCAEDTDSDTKANLVREIIVTDSKTVYLVDPNSELTVIDSRNFSANLSLGKPHKKYKTVTLKLINQRSLPVFIMPVSGGTFYLSPSNPILTLVFSNCVWSIVDNTQDINSFYPTMQQGSDLIPYDFVGANNVVQPGIAISADGNTFAVGGAGDNGGIGAVWVYVLRDDRWIQQAKLVANDSIGLAGQGMFVDLSADGNTLAFSGPFDNNNQGAVWVFVRNSCGVWIQQGPKLINVFGTAGMNFGAGGVSLSADGNTLAVGEPGDNTMEGGVWIYTRSQCTWTQGSHLVGTPSPLGAAQGLSVDISAEGTTVAFGSFIDTVWVFVYENGIWSQQGAPLTNITSFGYSVALSADGNTLAGGAPFYNPDAGAVVIYVREGGIWSQQGPPLQAVTSGTAFQGTTVALTSDGNTLLVGGVTDVLGPGTTWVWTRVDDNWYQALKIVNGVPSTYTLRGAFVAISSDGSTSVIMTVPTFPSPASVVVYI